MSSRTPSRDSGTVAGRSGCDGKGASAMTTDGYGFIVRDDGSIRLRFERRLSRRPEIVWQALTDGDLLARWMFRARFEPRAGGAMRFDYGQGGASQGTVLAWDEPTLLDYQWGATKGPTSTPTAT